MNEKEIMLTNVLDCDRIDLYSTDTKLTKDQEEKLHQMKIRRLNNEPLQYIVGTANFMGMDLKVDKRVFIPRPETEIMVDEAIKKLNGRKSLSVLDLGTGSGNIAIALAKAFDDIKVTSVDFSSKALSVASANASNQGLEKKIMFIHQRMEEFLLDQINLHKKFDLIISNPPYIKSENIANLPKDVLQEPHSALDGGKDGLDFLNVIIDKASLYLKEKSFLMLEIGDDQSSRVIQRLAETNCYSDISSIKDYTSVERIICSTLK